MYEYFCSYRGTGYALSDSHCSVCDVYFSFAFRYNNLLELGSQRAKKLNESCRAYQLVREAAELAQWIADKVCTTTYILGLGIGCNFTIDNQWQPTDRLLITISS